jgi:hypothetical protein
LLRTGAKTVPLALNLPGILAMWVKMTFLCCLVSARMILIG